MRAGFVAVDLRESGIDGWVRDDEAVNVREPEVAPDGVHHGDDRGMHESAVAELADVELDVCALDPDQRVEGVGLAPGEPAAELEGVQGVRVPGVPRQIGDGSELSGRHGVGLEREECRVGHGLAPGDGERASPGIAAHAVRH